MDKEVTSIYFKNKKMTSLERQKEILKLLENNKEVKFGDMSKIFDVTEMTIRRDIEKLEQKGAVYRTFGGAIMSPNKDITLKDRMGLMIAEKYQIGKTAASLIKPNEAIFIDSGTTTIQIARHLHLKSVTVITNAPQLAIELQEKSIPTILLGGQLLTSTISLIGPIAEENLKNMYFDRAFIAATGLTANSGLSNSNIFELNIKKLAMSQSKEVNVVLDSSKFEVESLASFASFGSISRLITDRNPPASILKVCENYRVELLVVST